MGQANVSYLLNGAFDTLFVVQGGAIMIKFVKHCSRLYKKSDDGLLLLFTLELNEICTKGPVGSRKKFQGSMLKKV